MSIPLPNLGGFIWYRNVVPAAGKIAPTFLQASRDLRTESLMALDDAENDEEPLMDQEEDDNDDDDYERTRNLKKRRWNLFFSLFFDKSSSIISKVDEIQKQMTNANPS